jgi:hypothetical protein
VSNGTFQWMNQSPTIPANRDCVILNSSNVAAINLSGLDLTVNGKFIGLFHNNPTTNSDTRATVLPGGQAATNATSFPIIYPPDPAPILPAPNVVAIGSGHYGYAGSLITPTGLVLDPAILASGVSAALDNISPTALARFVTVDTGQTSAAAGSVAALGGGSLTLAQIEASTVLAKKTDVINAGLI